MRSTMLCPKLHAMMEQKNRHASRSKATAAARDSTTQGLNDTVGSLLKKGFAGDHFQDHWIMYSSLAVQPAIYGLYVLCQESWHLGNS